MEMVKGYISFIVVMMFILIVAPFIITVEVIKQVITAIRDMLD